MPKDLKLTLTQDEAEILVGLLEDGAPRSFRVLVADAGSALAVVVRFLALLEMYRDAVLELDQEDHDAEGGHEHEPMTTEIEEDLRSQFEGVLEELPEPVLKLLANAAISVQDRPTAKQVQAGADPRSVVTFVGRPQTDDDEAHLEGIIIMRDFLLDEITDDDDIPELMIVSIIDELRRFFRLEGLEMGTGEE